MKASDLICIQGPTASGKSELAELVAQALSGEIISADSMQVYRGMDIGTAKVPPEMRHVRYHCLDLVNPGEPYSAALFQRDARCVIDSLVAAETPAILCGGTGFYVKAVLDEMDFAPGAQRENAVREKYQAYLDEHGAEALYALLQRADPQSAAAIHPHNAKRVIRALEMHEAGESYAERKAAFKHVAPHYPSVRFALSVERAVLYRRIDRRVDGMFAAGLVDEVRGLLAHGFRAGLTAPQAIGYKEVVSALDGTCSLDEASAQIKQATRRYAKRQLSWLRSDRGLIWLDATHASAKELCAQVLAHVLESSAEKA